MIDGNPHYFILKKKKKEQLQNGIPLVHYLLLGLVFKFVDCKFLLFLTWPIVS